MKKLFVLPGNSAKNQLWGIGAAKHFGGWFDETYIQQYDHWERGTNEMNIEAELAKLKDKAATETDELYVFAKSLGSLLALLSVSRGELKPQKCVFFGMPLDLASEHMFKEDWSPLEKFSVPALAFHNSQDPTANYEFTKTKLDALPEQHITLIESAGDTHEYLKFVEYEAKIKPFLSL